MMARSMRPFANAFVSAFTVVLHVSVIGCATAARQQQPARGSLTVGVTTAGGPPSLTFRVTIQPAGIAGSVKADAGVFTNDDLPFGDHVVRLSDLPAACRVEGAAERKITLSEQRRFAVLRFDVRCS